MSATQKLKLATVAVGLIIFLLSLLALLQIHRFQYLLIEVTSSLVSVPTQVLKRDVERTLSLGLALPDNPQLKVMLEQVNAQNESILSIHLIDADIDVGKVLWESGPTLSSPLRIVKAQLRSPKSMWFDTKDPTGFIQSWPVNDSIGRVAGNLVVRFDKSKPMALVANAERYLIYVWGALCLAALLILMPLMFHLMSGLDRMINLAKSIILGNGNLGANNSDIGRLAVQIADADRASAKAHP